MAALGLIDGQGRTTCPACDRAEDNSIPRDGGLKCFRETCPDQAPFFSNLGLVARKILNTTDIKGDAATARDNRRAAYNWLRTQFPHLPELRGRAAASKLDEVWASINEGIGRLPETPGATEATAQPATGTGANDATARARFTDHGNALRFASEYAGRVRHVHAFDRFYVWTGTHWQLDPRGQLVTDLARRLIARMYEAALHIEDAEARKAAAGWAMASQSRQRLAAIVSLIKSDPRLWAEQKTFDARADLLPVLNGTLDLSAKPPRFVPTHDPADYFTKVVPVEYDENATCPEFEAALAATSADPEVVAFRWRRYAQSLDGHADQHVVVQWGVPGSGKSTTNEAIAAVLGPYAAKVPKSVFQRSKNEQHPTHLMTLDGKRFAFGGEVGEYLDVDRLNELTGDETIQAHLMRQDFVDVANVWKLSYYSNKKPRITVGPENGIWRRLLLDPWTIKIGAPQDPSVVKGRFLAERKGIHTRLVKAYFEYQRMGLAPPPSVRAATQEYQTSQDNLQIFLDAHCDITNKDAKQAFGSLFDAYVSWAETDEPKFKITKKRFAQLLENHGFAKTTLNDRAKTDARLGVRLIESPSVPRSVAIRDEELHAIFGGDEVDAVPDQGAWSELGEDAPPLPEVQAALEHERARTNAGDAPAHRPGVVAAPSCEESWPTFVNPATPEPRIQVRFGQADVRLEPGSYSVRAKVGRTLGQIVDVVATVAGQRASFQLDAGDSAMLARLGFVGESDEYDDDRNICVGDLLFEGTVNADLLMEEGAHYLVVGSR